MRGSFAPPPNGGFVGCIVLTALSPQATSGLASVPQAWVSCASFTVVLGWYSGYVAFGNPLLSTTECRPQSAPPGPAAVSTGALAATRNWWFKNDPPKAAWKK